MTPQRCLIKPLSQTDRRLIIPLGALLYASTLLDTPIIGKSHIAMTCIGPSTNKQLVFFSGILPLSQLRGGGDS